MKFLLLNCLPIPNRRSQGHKQVLFSSSPTPHTTSKHLSKHLEFQVYLITQKGFSTLYAVLKEVFCCLICNWLLDISNWFGDMQRCRNCLDKGLPAGHRRCSQLPCEYQSMKTYIRSSIIPFIIPVSYSNLFT